MNKLLCILIAALGVSLLGGCSKNGTSAEPPSGFSAAAGDGRAVLTWTGRAGVDYWLFTATDPSLTAFVWTSLPNAHVYQNTASPFYMCGLLDGTQYWFAINGRIDGGPGGPSSPTISATPYQAGSTWAASAVPPLVPAPNLYGVGYASLKTCSNNATSAAGSFATVGASGVIATSTDGANWAIQATPSGFTSGLYAVTGHATYQNHPLSPGLRWIAVGDGGASVYSTDGIAWTAGRAYDANNPALRSITHSAGTYFAVGDAGTILSTTNGIQWISHASGTTSNLNGITRGNLYVAVGENGTILTSADGLTWTSRTSGTTVTLRQASSIGNTYVAVGDSGTVSISADSGVTWTVQTIAGAPNLVSVAANAQHTSQNSLGQSFTAANLATNSLFVAIDGSGNAYTSADGIAWSAPVAIGASANALVSSGFGYVAAGNAGATATAF